MLIKKNISLILTILIATLSVLAISYPSTKKKSTSFFKRIVQSIQKKKAVSPIEYIQWVKNKENGLTITKEAALCSYQLSYQPTDFLAMQNHGIPSNDEEMNMLKENFNTQQYYKLTIQSKNDSKKLINPDQQFQYLVSDILGDLSLIEGLDTLPCSFHHFVAHSQELDQGLQLLLAFPDYQSFEDRIVVFNNQLYGERIELKLDQNNLSAIPTIKFENE